MDFTGTHRVIPIRRSQSSIGRSSARSTSTAADLVALSVCRSGTAKAARMISA
jgi:hypothetical protein